MTEHLSALDGTFLELEEADDGAHMHIGAVMVFEPPNGSPPPALDDLRAHVGARLGALPRYRQRLSEHRTGGLRWPAWEPDPRFDLAAHVRGAMLPAPGGEEDLLDWAADFWSHRLDRGRPLWEIVLVDGLRDGRWALATKTHHCLVDGVGSVDVAQLLLDTRADARPASAPLDAVPAAEHSPELPGWLTAPAALAVQTARAGLRAVGHPRTLLHEARSVAELIVRDEVIGAPHTSLNDPIGATRRFACVRASLCDVKRTAHGLGGTINDVVLASVTGGLRTLLLARGDSLPADGLRAMVPVNVRAAGEHLGLGNRISSLFVPLPVAEATALERFRAVHEQAEKLKSGQQAEGARAMIDLTALLPPVLHATAARSLYATRLFNVTVTNVPGPSFPLYALGSRMIEVLPLVPLSADHALGVAVVSYDGAMFFGLIADHDAVPELDALAEGIEEDLEALGLATADVTADAELESLT